MIPDAKRVFAQCFSGEILAEHAPGERYARQFLSPILVVFSGISVDCLLGAAVDGEVCLPVTSKIQFVAHHRAVHRRLEDPGMDSHSLPDDHSRHASIYRKNLHGWFSDRPLREREPMVSFT